MLFAGKIFVYVIYRTSYEENIKLIYHTISIRKLSYLYDIK